MLHERQAVADAAFVELVIITSNADLFAASFADCCSWHRPKTRRKPQQMTGWQRADHKHIPQPRMTSLIDRYSAGPIA